MRSGGDAIRPRDGVKAPLLAALAAIALTLLVVLPALAQSNEGIVRYGGPPHPLIVAVFADVSDAQDGVPTNGVAAAGQLTTNDDAYILSGADARNSFFGGSLYISNQADAYNTILITSTMSGIADGACARATVRNEYTKVAVELWLAATREAPVDGARTYQGVVSAAPRHDNASQGPACTTAEATSPDGTVGESLEAGTAETAQIPARDRDRVSITVAGSTYTAGVTVDGDGPVFWVLSPRPDSILSSRTIPFSFEVTDDGSGLRHDGEDIVSANGRRIPENVDDDHFTIEGTALHSERRRIGHPRLPEQRPRLDTHRGERHNAVRFPWVGARHGRRGLPIFRRCARTRRWVLSHRVRSHGSRRQHDDSQPCVSRGFSHAGTDPNAGTNTYAGADSRAHTGANSHGGTCA